MPSISTKEMARYHATARARAVQREQELLAYRTQAWTIGRNAAALLRTQDGVKRVVLFGSLARNECCSPHSDVDLVVWGLPEALHYRVVAQLLDLDGTIPVDLLRGEDVSERLRQHIEFEGIEL